MRVGEPPQSSPVYLSAMRLPLVLLLSLVSTCLHAQTNSTLPVSDNAKLTEMFTVDQQAREGDHIDWAKLTKDDQQRRGDLREMLSAGGVRTGNDYFHAAMIFQHGQNPDEYLIAHVLAMDAVALGSKEARWLSAATLDRYLLSIWQPQVFGTQFHSGPNSGVMTHDKINPAIVSDPMREATCVVSASAQDKVLETVNHGGKFGSTQSKEDHCKLSDAPSQAHQSSPTKPF